MPKPIVFISHITPEKEIAIAFKDLIEASFLDMIEVFVSSDEQSIGMGQRWLDNITSALKTCKVEIILCSPQSIQRPWINFEAGAGWIRNISVIPLCHSGMEPSKLPLPLNLLQAATAGHASSLNLIFPVLAQAIGSATPRVDFTDFIAKVTDFERRYTFWDACNGAFSKLKAFNAQIIPALRTGKRIKLDLTETTIEKFGHFMPFLTQNNILRFQREGDTIVSTDGTFYSCSLNPMAKLAEILSDTNFQN